MSGNISNFNTNNVTTLSGIFERCTSLKEISHSNFKTNNVTDRSYTFYGCSFFKRIQSF